MAQESRLKKVKSLDAAADLISELPRGVLDAIMERLPLRDAARMSVLSHKWLEIWTSIQQLAFDAHFFSRVLKHNMYDTNEFSRVVSKVLFHHEGHLIRFHLYIPCLESCPDVNQWICYVSRTGVSELSIQNQYIDPLRLSSHIFSCVNLQTLKLNHCIINPPPSFRGFRKMTSLELHKIKLGEKAFQRLISSCPLLQKLRLTNFTGMVHIIIDAPYLCRLILDGTFISLDVRNPANLVSALIGLQKWSQVCHRASIRVLIQGLASSNKFEKLCLRGWFCKVLFRESLLPTAFTKLRNLDLSSIHLNDLDDFSSIVCTIQRCPNIDKLTISVSSSRHLVYPALDYNPNCLLHHLRYADVIICSGSCMELILVEFLLACSPVLEMLKVTSNGHIKEKHLSRMVMELIRFRRASQKVEVIFPEPAFSVPLGGSDSELTANSNSSDSD